MEAVKKEYSVADLEDNTNAIIIEIRGGKKAAKRLADLGLKPGAEVRAIRQALFSGPVQIEVNGSRLVLGRGLAEKIIVEQK